MVLQSPLFGCLPPPGFRVLRAVSEGRQACAGLLIQVGSGALISCEGSLDLQQIPGAQGEDRGFAPDTCGERRRFVRLTAGAVAPRLATLPRQRDE